MSNRTLAGPDTSLELSTMPDGLSSSETKLVHLVLQVTDGCTVEELHRALDVRRLSLFPILDTLRRRDLFDADDVVDWRRA